MPHRQPKQLLRLNKSRSPIRPTGWYFSKSAYHGDKHEWRGPYASEFSVTVMIARELRKEIKKRHKL
jgi:hypothetical protein